MIYFNECSTIDHVKSVYMTLAKIHHPGKGGDLAIMQAINNEFSFATAKIARGENLTDDEINDLIAENEKYRLALNAIICVSDINIELVGSTIWVTGNTYSCRATLKAAGFYITYKNIAWYVRKDELFSLHDGKLLPAGLKIKAKIKAAEDKKRTRRRLS
jgi:hypothetical protein